MSVGGKTSLLEEGSNPKDMKSENSETRLSDLDIAFAKLENYAQAMKDNRFQITDPKVVEKVIVLFDKMCQQLPPEKQEQVRIELSAKIFQDSEDDPRSLSAGL